MSRAPLQVASVGTNACQISPLNTRERGSNTVLEFELERRLQISNLVASMSDYIPCLKNISILGPVAIAYPWQDVMDAAEYNGNSSLDCATGGT